jgi:hypothetical protein
MEDERTGITHDFTRKGGVEWSAQLCPDDAPDWQRDPAQFWNHAEQAEKHPRAQIARDYRIPVPLGFDRAHAQALAKSVARSIGRELNAPVSVALHRDNAQDRFGVEKDEQTRGFHAHLYLPCRGVEQGGMAKNKSGIFRDLANCNQSGKIIDRWAETWAEKATLLAREQGLDLTFDHRSYERQGFDLIPEPKMGTTAVEMERRGMDSRKGGEALNAKIEQAQQWGRLHAQDKQRQQEPARKKQCVAQQQQALPPGRSEGSVPTLHRGLYLAPRSTLATRSGTGVERGATLADGKTKQQWQEERRQGEERRLVQEQMTWEQKQLRRYINDLIASGKRIQKQQEEALQMLVDEARPLTSQTIRFRSWLAERAFIVGALDDTRAEPGKRQEALDQARASLERRQKRLDRFSSEPEEAEPSRIHWKSHRAWVERRRARADRHQLLKTKVWHAVKRERIACGKLSPEALDQIRQKINAVNVALARHDAAQARLFPDHGLAQSELTAATASHTLDRQTCPGGSAGEKQQHQYAQISVTPRPELRPRRR